MTAFELIPVSRRGQITIPKRFRKDMKTTHLYCRMKNGAIILEPLQTRDDFLRELEESEKKWKKKGGVFFEDVMKKSHKQP